MPLQKRKMLNENFFSSVNESRSLDETVSKSNERIDLGTNAKGINRRAQCFFCEIQHRFGELTKAGSALPSVLDGFFGSPIVIIEDRRNGNRSSLLGEQLSDKRSEVRNLRDQVG